MKSLPFLCAVLVPVIGIVGGFLVSCASKPNAVDPPVTVVADDKVGEKTKSFRQYLMRAIENADQIKLIEHSHKTDFLDVVTDINTAPTYVYNEKELRVGEKVLFLEKVRKISGKRQMMQTDCLFVDHHTIEFYEQGSILNRMNICFSCSEIEWEDKQRDVSKEMFDVLKSLVQQAGMQLQREWSKLAKDRYAELNKADESKIMNRAPVASDPKVVIPEAKWASGQKGKKVVNPFTGKLVDVEGIPSGTKVMDPTDSNQKHVFRVP